MKKQEYTFESSDGMLIHVNKCLPEKGKAKAVVQIVHGSVEHVDRYMEFAKFLTDNRYAVYASDLRGHGKTAGSEENLSYFSDEKDGWNLAIKDLKKITGDIDIEFPQKPVFLFGHSMGSMLVRDYISKHGEGLQGAIISGTAGGFPILLNAAKLISRMAMTLKGRKSRSLFLHKLVYGTLNDGIENAVTDYDFLSKDPEEVQKYIDDLYCGYTVTPEYIYELSKGALGICKTKAFKNTPSDMPLYIFSGDNDPAGGIKGNDVIKVYEKYREWG